MFPSTLSTFSRPTTTSKLNNPSHSALHNTISSALGQVEAVIGKSDSGSVLGTIIGDLRSPASNGGGHVQTANKGGTGQTTFAKGDILVAQSASVLTKLSVGADGTALYADSTQASGIKWGLGEANVRNYGYSSSVITWTKPTGLTFIDVELWGGGGSGGAHSNGGQGGGGGAYNKVRVYASVLGATEYLYIGAGGAAVSAPSGGNAGKVTVFGASSIVSAFGGGGGSFNSEEGGGGGGGSTSAGSNGTTEGGAGGEPIGGAGSSGAGGTAIFGGGGGGGADNAAGGKSYWGGGGGGGISAAGGTSYYGGGGGGSTGGVSTYGGNGGAHGGATGTAGSVPSGGGGGGTSTSGAGANGQARITEY